MNKDEILEKSRLENKNQDIYEQDVMKQAYAFSAAAMLILIAVFFVAEIFAGDDPNLGFWAILACSSMAASWVKYVKLYRKLDLASAVLYTLLTVLLSGLYLYDLFASSPIL